MRRDQSFGMGYEMGLGRGEGRSNGRGRRSAHQGDGRRRGGELHQCHERSDDRFGMGGHRGFGEGRYEQGGYHAHRGHHSGRGHGMMGCHGRSDDRFEGGRGHSEGRRGHGHGEGCGKGNGHRNGHGNGMGRGRGEGRGRGQGRGDARFGGARRISSEELQMLVLTLLAEESLHGYQIIKELEERSHGFYKPSPGMIYPLLAFIEESDLAEVTLDGTKKLFSLTDAGRAEIAGKQVEAEKLLSWLEAQGQLIVAMENAYEVSREASESPFRAKMKAMRTLLRERDDLDEAQSAEILAILDEAITKIERV